MRSAPSFTRPLSAASLDNGLIFKRRIFELHSTIVLFSSLVKLIGSVLLLMSGDCYVSCLISTWVLLGVMYDGWKITSIGSDHFSTEFGGHRSSRGIVCLLRKKGGGLSHVLNNCVHMG
jgi:hypothetical protein